MDPMTPYPGYDPSYTAIVGPYTATMNQYVRGDLGYRSDLPLRDPHRQGLALGLLGCFENCFVAVADRLRTAMVKNPSLRVFQASGYFDLATPHFAADYVVDHMQLPEFRITSRPSTIPPVT